MVDSLGSGTSRLSWYSLTLFWVCWSAFGDLGPVVGGKGATASAWRLEIDGDETAVCGTCHLITKLIAKHFIRNNTYRYLHNPAQHKSVDTEMLRLQVGIKPAQFSWLHAPVRKNTRCQVYIQMARAVVDACVFCMRPKYRWGYRAMGGDEVEYNRENGRHITFD